MWKARRPEEVDVKKDVSETVIDNRDKNIRELIDELVSGTQELRSLYRGDKNAPPRPDPA